MDKSGKNAQVPVMTVMGYSFLLFQFSNLLGSVYKKGNVLFTPDGNSVISPVGNRVSIFDLKK